MVGVRCPKCGHEFAVEDAMRGRNDRCPRCAAAVPVRAAGPGSAVLVRLPAVVRIPLSDADAPLKPEFDRYLDALAAVVLASDLFAADGPGAEYLVPVTLAPGGRPSFAALTVPGELMPDRSALAVLLAALFAVPAPQLRGTSAEATLMFAVRGGSGR